MKGNFNEAVFIGCWFHWKQAIRRKLVKQFHIPLNMVSELMDGNGLINLLNIIPVNEIIVKGIPYIRAHFDEKTYSRQFDEFWVYFVKTWMKYYSPTDWNINHIISMGTESMESICINRTNNPLERFNRTFGEIMGNHPNMVNFLKGLLKISEDYLDLMSRIRRKIIRKPIQNDPTNQHLPEDYVNWLTGFEDD